MGCYIRNGIAWQRRKDLEKESVEAIWLEVLLKKSSPLLVCNIYRPPDTSRYLVNNFENLFKGMLDDTVYENKDTILLGDINVDYHNTSDNREMKRILSQHGFNQVISKATRVTKETSTLIDIAASTHEQNISKHGTWGMSLSDHDLIGVIIKKNNRNFTHRTIRGANPNFFLGGCTFEGPSFHKRA